MAKDVAAFRDLMADVSRLVLGKGNGIGNGNGNEACQALD